MGRLDGITIAGLYDDPVTLGSVFDELPVAVVFISRDRRVVYQNRAAEVLTGFSSDEARGLTCAHVVRSSICGSRCPVKDDLGGEESVSEDGDVIARDRRKIPVHAVFSRVRSKDGRCVGYVEILESLEDSAQRQDSSANPFSVGDIIGRSPTMERLFSILPGIAQTDSSVLITGETGTGKDLLAEVIHKMSNRSKGPFVKVNCGALPETLLESELFGHVKGAFTGATHNKPGRFRLAHNGTLFLTEIGDLPLSLQVKLLTFLDDHVIYPLGSGSGIRVNVRIIAATHRDLAAMVREGRFREDLLFRLNVVRLHVPPLREREGDVQLLMDHFLRTFSSRFGKKIVRFSPEARSILLDYSYPGNVRELKNIVEYAVNVCTGNSITPEHIPAYVVEAVRSGKKEADGVSSEGCEKLYKEEVTPELNSSAPQVKWEDMERRMILEALVKAGGRKSKAARMLGWGRATLWRKMKQYGIT
ncbi:sigma-54 interaction domain-containing protein [Thermodesulforhabdus norvegica]|uniref:PAS domain S-box-containing protein n=1 Tax=Thermodesulforhabdus norvegica TaxID=39841 RepID=A0A1I4SGX8_9BACT|nr:sigma 54-interacting transcriptional regulator [Thermodesulforhabdus norvegica]SFM63553.1 PAS domain S-box-containing protein [Thermodesulforhabdus norvegica]